MKVSVLMPVYKTDESFLREAIESVLAQTFRDFEFLILDDCPEDDREGVVRSYRDARIVYLKNDRTLGIAGARNRLLDLAKGEYLAVFDHDDVCAPERLAEEVAYLDAHPDCGVVSSWVRIFSTPPQAVGPARRAGRVKRFPENDHDIKLLMMRESALWHPAAMIRREVLVRRALRYDSSVTPAEDYMLWLNLAATHHPLPSTHYPLPSTHYPLPSTLYPLPSTLYPLPSTLYPLPSTLYPLPSTHYPLPSTLYPLPSLSFHNLPKPLLDYRLHAGSTSAVRKAELEAADLRCKAWAKVHLPELWEEYLMRRTTIRHVRLLGLPLLKIVSARDRLDVLLFDCLPLVRIAFRDRFET